MQTDSDEVRAAAKRAILHTAECYLGRGQGAPFLPEHRPDLRHHWALGYARGLAHATWLWPDADRQDLVAAIAALCGCDRCRPVVPTR